MKSILVLGVFLVVVGCALVVLGSGMQSGSSVGGIILIGPLPIVFGEGPHGELLLLLSVATGVLMVALLLLYALRQHALTDKGDEEIDK